MRILLFVMRFVASLLSRLIYSPCWTRVAWCAIRIIVALTALYTHSSTSALTTLTLTCCICSARSSVIPSCTPRWLVPSRVWCIRWESWGRFVLPGLVTWTQCKTALADPLMLGAPYPSLCLIPSKLMVPHGRSRLYTRAGLMVGGLSSRFSTRAVHPSRS